MKTLPKLSFNRLIQEETLYKVFITTIIICAIIIGISKIYNIGSEFYLYRIDGIYINKILTYTQGIDPLDMKTEWEVYSPGETLSIVTSFCKNREATSITSYTWYDKEGNIVKIMPPIGPRGVSMGCQPLDQHKTITAALFVIPEDIQPGSYSLVGAIQRILPNGRNIPDKIVIKNVNIK